MSDVDHLFVFLARFIDTKSYDSSPPTLCRANNLVNRGKSSLNSHFRNLLVLLTAILCVVLPFCTSKSHAGYWEVVEYTYTGEATWTEVNWQTLEQTQVTQEWNIPPYGNVNPYLVGVFQTPQGLQFQVPYKHYYSKARVKFNAKWQWHSNSATDLPPASLE